MLFSTFVSVVVTIWNRYPREPASLQAYAWKFLIVLAFEPRPMDAYRIVAWLGFIPNLLVAEWLIRRYRRRRADSPQTQTP